MMSIKTYRKEKLYGVGNTKKAEGRKETQKKSERYGLREEEEEEEEREIY